jgi:hypothetical protein
VILLSPSTFPGCLFFHQRSFVQAPLYFLVLLFSSDVFCVSPFMFSGWLFFIGCLLSKPLCVFWMPFFLSEVFYVSPFAFLRCLFFHQRSFVWAPLRFWGASFFIGGLLFEPLCVLGASFFIRALLREPLCVFRVPLFSSNVFCVSPFTFSGCHFFHRRSCVSQWMRGLNNAPLFMASMCLRETHVEFSVNLVSCFDYALTWELFLKQNFVEASWYISSASLKTSHPCGLPLWEKEYGL